MEWNRLDKFIGKLRYAQVQKYITEGISIVDVGCGRTAEFLMKNSHAIKDGIGLDFRIQNEMKAPNIKLINNKELKAFPIEEKTIDCVFLNAVLEHLEDPVTVLTECKRVLKIGGRIIMTTPTRAAKPILEFMAFKLHVINEDEILEHKHYYSKMEIVLLANKLGVTLEKYGYFEMGMNSIIVLQKV